MEKTTLINANGNPYEREIPKVIILSWMNDIAFDWLCKQTGIKFRKTIDGFYEGQPETWEQFSKIFLTYNFLNHGVNNFDGNLMYLRLDCNSPSGATLYYKKDGREFVGVRGVD